VNKDEGPSARLDLHDARFYLIVTVASANREGVQAAQRQCAAESGRVDSWQKMVFLSALIKGHVAVCDPSKIIEESWGSAP
jgi:hypothetical protein